MTNKKRYALLFVFILATVFMNRNPESTMKSHTKDSGAKTQSAPNDSQRLVIDKNHRPIKRLPASVSYVNTPSLDWEKRLETSLKVQGGSELKEIKIKKEKSLVWMRDENPLMVESVVVTLTNQQDVASSFRALVDSQTGKVLESWDRTVFEPAPGAEESRFKLDSRYSN